MAINAAEALWLLLLAWISGSRWVEEWHGDAALRHRIRLDIDWEWSVGRDMSDATRKKVQLVSAEAVTAEIDRLSGLSLVELKAAWQAKFQRVPPQGLWRDLLLRTLAWRLQEKAFGGHDKATVKLLEAYGRKKDGVQLFQRLKPGTVLIREFEGVRHSVTITAEGYVWQDKAYSSLSAIAKAIAGTNWNGPRFFGLREGGKARRWVDTLMAGGTLAQIAKDEAKSERYIRMLIPAAFVSPKIACALIQNETPAMSVAELSRNVALIW